MKKFQEVVIYCKSKELYNVLLTDLRQSFGLSLSFDDETLEADKSNVIAFNNEGTFQGLVEGCFQLEENDVVFNIPTEWDSVIEHFDNVCIELIKEKALEKLQEVTKQAKNIFDIGDKVSFREFCKEKIFHVSKLVDTSVILKEIGEYMPYHMDMLFKVGKDVEPQIDADIAEQAESNEIRTTEIMNQLISEKIEELEDVIEDFGFINKGDGNLVKIDDYQVTYDENTSSYGVVITTIFGDVFSCDESVLMESLYTTEEYLSYINSSFTVAQKIEAYELFEDYLYCRVVLANENHMSEDIYSIDYLDFIGDQSLVYIETVATEEDGYQRLVCNDINFVSVDEYLDSLEDKEDEVDFKNLFNTNEFAGDSNYDSQSSSTCFDEVKEEVKDDIVDFGKLFNIANDLTKNINFEEILKDINVSDIFNGVKDTLEAKKEVIKEDLSKFDIQNIVDILKKIR